MDAKKLILPALAVAAYYAFVTRKAIGMLNYYIKGVGLTFDGYSPLLLLNIEIQNPSNSQFVINDFLGSLSVNGTNVGSAESFVKTTIPAASQVTYPIIIRLNLIGVVSDLISLLQKQSGLSMDVEFKGYVNASGIVAPVDLPYKIAF
jgi:LEA14-like dessication related protein